MKKTIAIILSLVMLLGIGGFALADTVDTNSLADKSTYLLTLDQPDEIIAGEKADLVLTLEPDVTDQDGYEELWYDIELVDCPSGADAVFDAEYGDDLEKHFTLVLNDNEVLDTQSDIDEDSDDKVNLSVEFSDIGDYTLLFTAYSDVDRDDAVEIDKLTAVINVDEESNDGEEDDDGIIDDDKNGNTHGLLNAVRNHLRKDNRNHGYDRLMELLAMRGLSATEVEDAIEAMEEAIADNDGDVEDFKVLSKMHKIKGEKLHTYVNGKSVDYDVEPELENGRTLVPIRKIAEALGCEVQYINNQVIFTKGTTKITITPNETEATILKDGKTTTVEMDVAAKIVDGRTLIPLRFVSEQLDTIVDYYPEGALIVIKSII